MAVRSSHGLEVPLSDPTSGQLLVDRNYVVFLTKLANDKLAENLKRIQLFEARCAKFVWSNAGASTSETIAQKLESLTVAENVDECLGNLETITVDGETSLG